MPLKITVNSTDVLHMAGVSAKTQKPYALDFQVMWFFTCDKSGNVNPYPEKVEVMLEKNASGGPIVHPVGEYLLADSSVYVDRMGNLAVRPVLIPLKK